MATKQDPAGIRYIAPTYIDAAGGQRRPTARQSFVANKLLENAGNGTPSTLGAVLREAGYSPATAKTPDRVLESKGFMELLEDVLPDDQLIEVHKNLLQSKKLDHMVFPLGPVDEDDPNFSGAEPNGPNVIEKAGVPVERTTLTDQEIKELIASTGGTVRRIVHGDTARHVYFWAPNDKARQDALKLAYELKGKTGKNVVPPAPTTNNTYNTYIQNNSMDPNAPAIKHNIVDVTLDALMERTKRKVIEGEIVNDRDKN